MAAELTTIEREGLLRGLQSAYYSQGEIEQLVYFGLGERLDDIAAPGTLPARIMAVIQWAEASGRADELVRVAHERRGGNAKLHAFWSRYATSPQRQVTHDALERLTDSAMRLKNPAVWRDQMARAENCVCRVVIGDRPAGTGFVAGPGLLITNYHVIEDAGNRPIHAEFGYRMTTDGKLETGRRYEVLPAPVFTRPYSQVDLQYPKPHSPSADELDLAVLEVAGKPELDLVDEHPRATLVPARVPRLSPGDLVTIIQHPLGETLQFAYERVIEVNDNQTRVTYKVQTQGGSSGSPCFDADWNLVAIHHGGDPRSGTAIGEFNEGIPIATIRAGLPPELATRLGWV
jgi:hypothetical protein|nr:trypsin-like peptidase domain-containing protein [Kofleriaceae bacterium]